MEERVSQTITPAMSLTGFLQFLYKGIDHGYAYAPTLDRETGKFNQVFVSISNLARLEQHIREASEQTDVYLSPAVFSVARASKESFLASNVVWTEFDGNAPTNFTDVPSVIVQSSNEGFAHCYWRLDEPCRNPFDLEEVNRALCFTLGADRSGWDATQILRPPETFNFKREARVTIAGLSGLIYTLGNFTNYQAPDRIDESAIELDHIPDVMDVIYKHSFSPEFKTAFTSNPTEGSRSTTYVYIGYLAAEAGLNNEELYSILRNFDERVGKYRSRNDRHRRLLDIIERVRLKYPTQFETTSEDSTEQSIEIYDVVSFDNADFHVEWLLPGLLQAGGNLLLSGPPGVGKTQVALNFGFGLASNTDVLGFCADRPCRVLFVSCEMGATDLKYFTSRIMQRYEDQRELLKENLFVLPLGEPLYLSSAQGQDTLLRLAEKLKLDGIIFDSLGSATTKALTDEESTKALLDFNDRFRKNMDVFTWYIHHNRKATENNKEPSGLADVYGSQYLTARATTVLSLWPQRKNLLKVRELKVRLAPEKDDWYIKRTENLKFEIASPAEIESLNTVKKGNVNGQQPFTNRFGI